MDPKAEFTTQFLAKKHQTLKISFIALSSAIIEYYSTQSRKMAGWNPPKRRRIPFQNLRPNSKCSRDDVVLARFQDGLYYITRPISNSRIFLAREILVSLQYTTLFRGEELAK